MITVGAFEAKTHFSTLLDKVEAGEEILITRHGKPAARIVRARHHNQSEIDQAVDGLISLSSKLTLGGLSRKDLRDEGRK
jgi:prevent-host-death family protein